MSSLFAVLLMSGVWVFVQWIVWIGLGWVHTAGRENLLRPCVNCKASCSRQLLITVCVFSACAAASLCLPATAEVWLRQQAPGGWRKHPLAVEALSRQVLSPDCCELLDGLLEMDEVCVGCLTVG